MHQIVDLDAFLDPGLSEPCAVDCAVCADLHVVVDLDNSVLRHLHETRESRIIAEPVRADCGSRMDDDFAAELAVAHD